MVAFFPLFVVFCVTFLEIIIAFLQAYVFFVLLTIYLNDVINLH
jgi:F0F1-type ATP synthase membrane subunit a